jgi:maltose O-acetyltransferase
MRSEKSKMLAGELYDPADAELAADRAKAHELCRLLRVSAARDIQDLLSRLLGKPGPHLITPPFFCDYGYNIELDSDVYFNANCVVLDVCRITIGARTLIGPGVHIYAAAHPMDASVRKAGLEFGRPVKIGADVWIGGGVIVCPGVSVGANAVIGAGSVVTRDVAAGVFAAGNPCRELRSL